MKRLIWFVAGIITVALLSSCSTNSVMGLSKASYTEAEFRKLNEQINKLQEQTEQAVEAGKRLDALAVQFEEKLNKISITTLEKLALLIQEYIDSEGSE